MSVLNQSNRDYLASMKPESTPDWRKSWEWGYEEGKKIEMDRTPFHEYYDVEDEIVYRMQCAERGELTWQINTGLATVEDQVNALKTAWEFNQQTGLKISFAHQLPKNIVGTPKDKREGIPTNVGFDLNEREDWQRIAQAAPIMPIFGDNHLGYPNTVETTRYCLMAGCRYQGMFGMFQQVAPGCPDEVWNMNEVMKGLGMCAAKWDKHVIVASNQDDSMPAYFMDLASYLAWGMWERYVVTDLCKTRYAYSFGNLTSNILHKAAMWLAASDTFSLDDQPGVEFIYPNTVDHWDHHLHSNYGFQVPEGLMFTLLEKKYKTGGSILMVPISEKVAIPTVPEMLDMQGAQQRTAEGADNWMEIINWAPIEKLRDETIALAKQMFENIIQGFKEAGIDVENPIEMMVVLKLMDPTKFESMFHPSIVQDGNETLKPLMPAALWESSIGIADAIIKDLEGSEAAANVKGKRIIVCSADLHYYGSFVVKEVLRHFGADVIDGGNSMDAIDVLDVADEHGVKDVCISLHNGQTLGYARLLLDLAAERSNEYNFYFGGKITSFLNEGDEAPSDVTKEINEMGIYAGESIEGLMAAIK